MSDIDKIKDKQKELHQKVDEIRYAGCVHEKFNNLYESIFPQMSKLVDDCLTILKDKNVVN